MEKVINKRPDKKKYYPVRAGDNLTKLREWLKWAKKTSKGQRFIIVNEYKIRMAEAKTPELKKYWKYRYGAGLESKYDIYGSY